MISANPVVVLEKAEMQVVRIEQGARVAIVESSKDPVFQVLSVGLQGPVGTVAEEVLSMAARAESLALEALALANQTDADLDQFVQGFSGAIAYQSGVISAG
ncbi:hypothetical protein V6238_18295 [Marinomonas arenicola]|uniref:hypothetical protein n=1 Tax=Marinomonas arenicola TaxID=569601 RepID=UPI00311E1FE5